MAIGQGTTPTQTFTLPFSSEEISSLKVTYKQGTSIVLVKKLDECVLDGEKVKIRLSQEDTFKFTAAKPLLFQMRLVNRQGDAFKTKIFQTQVEESLDNEVI